MNLPFQIAEILSRLENFGYEAYVVGGCVRDYLMGAEPHDFDVATSAEPSETERVFSDCRVIETGIKHGTVTVLYKGNSVEITTFRVDGGYSDGRHPDAVTFTRNVENDLARRDFTMNGIAYSPKTGFVDPFNGGEDIKKGVIRCIGDPGERFGEDALRILRALRFSAVLGFEIEDKTADMIRSMRGALFKVSAERVFSEMRRMLCGKDIKRVMLEYTEIFTLIVPELGEQIGYEQDSRYHNSTLYEHTARSVEAAPETDVMRLAMLFHDTGKPRCRTTDENGEGHYYGHAAVSAEIADKELRKLKSSNALRERVCEIVKYHDSPVDTSRRVIRRALSRHGLDAFIDIQNAHIADDTAKADFCRERIPKALEAIDIARVIWEEKPAMSVKDLAVSGNDLKALVPPSPRMGEILNALFKEVTDGVLPNEKKALMERASALVDAVRE